MRLRRQVIEIEEKRILAADKRGSTQIKHLIPICVYRRLSVCGLLLGQLGWGFAPVNVVNKAWPAKWIAVPGSSPQKYGVYHFRKTFELAAKPEHFVVHVSGDNRYQLFVNGERVAWGPARGDLTHWRYETVDLSVHMQAGRNVLAAVVWNDGEQRAIAQVTNRAGFLLQAADSEQSVGNTGRGWKCSVDKAYAAQLWPRDQRTGYYALGPNERVNGALYPWGWETKEFDDGAWSQAEELTPGAPRDLQDGPNRWMLVPSAIPLEEQKRERAFQVRDGPGMPLLVPAHNERQVLLDQMYLTTAYPELKVSGGAGATIDLQYAETLYQSKGVKGNRDEVTGRQFFGPMDTFVADGGQERVYRPLFWRTYRYVEVHVQTADEPLQLKELRGTFTGYPFERSGEFEVSDPQQNAELQKILSTGWRTARLCAHETYMDCPFYEQLQYGGDARIQMMVSLYMTGDARLMKNGIALLNSSRTAEGATYSRAPSGLQQYIPPFSLWWIGMVHDYWMYVDDALFVKQMLPGVRAVLEFYAPYQKANGSLRKMPWWNFVDWVKQWPGGAPPAEEDGSSSAPLDLQLALAYGWAADLEKAMGSAALGDEYRRSAEALKTTVAATDWDQSAGLFADQPSHRTYSQQVNTLAALAHVVPGGQERSVVEKMLASHEMAQSSIYFRAYTNAALREAGLGDRYVSQLGPWREMLRDGLTTWAEWNGADTRSDCHAWGASPNFELLRTVAGIESMAPGFKRVRIAPNPGSFAEVTAQMPHPKGMIEVKLRRKAGLMADVQLPDGTEGELDWEGKVYPLHSGANHVGAP